MARTKKTDVDTEFLDDEVKSEDEAPVKRHFGGIKTDKGGRPVMDEGGRPVLESAE